MEQKTLKDLSSDLLKKIFYSFYVCLAHDGDDGDDDDVVKQSHIAVLLLLLLLLLLLPTITCTAFLKTHRSDLLTALVGYYMAGAT